MSEQKSVGRGELAKLPYLDPSLLGARIAPLLAFHDPNRGDRPWRVWYPLDQSLNELSVVNFVRGEYIAAERADRADLDLALTNLVLKRALTPEAKAWADRIASDVNNLATSLVKVDHFFECGALDEGSKCAMASTEIEFLVTTVRSLFDLLQELIGVLWLAYPPEGGRRRELPGRFAKMALLKNRVATCDEIRERHEIPPDLAEFYVRHAPFLFWIRQIREAIVHGGYSFRVIYATERGFAVPTREKLFDNCPIWSSDNCLENNLGSLRAAAAYLARYAVSVSEDLAETLVRLLALPDDVCGGYKVFIRGPHLRELTELDYRIGAGAWVR